MCPAPFRWKGTLSSAASSLSGAPLYTQTVGGEVDSLGTVDSRGFEDVRRAHHVERGAVNRVLVGVVDVGNCCQVEDVLGAARGCEDRREVEKIHVFELHVVAVRAHSVIDDSDFVACVRQ